MLATDEIFSSITESYKSEKLGTPTHEVDEWSSKADKLVSFSGMQTFQY